MSFYEDDDSSISFNDCLTCQELLASLTAPCVLWVKNVVNAFTKEYIMFSGKNVENMITEYRDKNIVKLKVMKNRKIK